jgi:D-amino-acid dehydrogenase
MRSSDQNDVLVLGGGVIGLAIAQHLLKAGRSVTVLEKKELGSGASLGNCGTLTPSHAPPLAMPGMLFNALACMLKPDAPFYIKPRVDFKLAAWLFHFARRCNWQDFSAANQARAALLVRSRYLLEQLIREENLDCGFEALGTLYLYRSSKLFSQMKWLPKALSEVDIAIESLSGDDIRRLEPCVHSSVVAGFFNPMDAHLRPDRYVYALAARVRELGGRILEGVEVHNFQVTKKSISNIETNQGDFSANEMVMALGAWSPLVAQKLNMRVPIQPGKGYSITFSGSELAPRIPMVLKERSVCVTAWPGGYRLGSTMEFSGYDASLNRRRIDALNRAASEYLHLPSSPSSPEEWCGWRAMTYDDLPIIGRSVRYDNLIWATGHGMMGVTMSAVTAEMVRNALLSPSDTFIDRACSPARFSL